MELFQLTVGDSPLVAAAIHNGHFVRPEIAPLLGLGEAERLREEDPFTDRLIDWAPTRIVGCRSRFEVDLNRPRDQAIYLTPEHAWGLRVWHEPPAAEVAAHSLANYDLFYSTAEALLRQLVNFHGRVIVLDVHSYNHRRDGADQEAADAETHPEVNVGTGTMNRDRWAPVVDGFISELKSYNFQGRRLDVRENVKFQGGNFCRWIHHTFPESVCALAVEFKKVFMNEWSGEVNRPHLANLQAALQSTAPRLLQILSEMQNGAFSTTSP
jgi:N-formylglutamate amidohydrolase